MQIIVLETTPGDYKPEVLLRDWRCKAGARIWGGTSKEAGGWGRVRMDWAHGIRHNLQTRWNSATHSENNGSSAKSTFKFIRTKFISILIANYFLLLLSEKCLAVKRLDYFQRKVCTILNGKFYLFIHDQINIRNIVFINKQGKLDSSFPWYMSSIPAFKCGIDLTLVFDFLIYCLR